MLLLWWHNYLIDCLEENLLFESDLSGPPSFFLMFSLLLMDVTFVFLFENFKLCPVCSTPPLRAQYELSCITRKSGGRFIDTTITLLSKSKISTL